MSLSCQPQPVSLANEKAAMTTDMIYGLIGCGMMGMEHIHNVNRLPGARFCAIYDPIADNAARGAQLAGGALVAPSLDALLATPGLDAFIICSPNFRHVEQIEAIAATRPIPILCEKPLYTSPLDAPRIQALARDYPAPIWVAMEYRYMPPIAAFIEEVDQATGGVKMLTLREHRIPFLDKFENWNRFNENTGGTLVEKCCHFFDLMRLILRSEPVRVMASAGQMVNYKSENYGGRTPDIWDAGYAIFDFENGARAMLELCMFADGTKWNEEISAIGPDGKIECRVPGPQRFWPNDLGPPPVPELSLYPRRDRNPQTLALPLDPALTQLGDHHGATFHQHAKFLEIVRGFHSSEAISREAVTPEILVPEVTLDDGARAVNMGLAAQEAALSHCVVEFH